MTDLWIKRTLLLAALWNIAGGISALLDPSGHFTLLYQTRLTLDQPLQRFFYQCTWINVIAWGTAYLLAAYRPAARMVVLVAGGGGKLVYFAACAQLFLSGVGTGMLLLSGLIDLAFALSFVMGIMALHRRTRG